MCTRLFLKKRKDRTQNKSLGPQLGGAGCGCPQGPFARKKGVGSAEGTPGRRCDSWRSGAPSLSTALAPQPEATRSQGEGKPGKQGPRLSYPHSGPPTHTHMHSEETQTQTDTGIVDTQRSRHTHAQTYMRARAHPGTHTRAHTEAQITHEEAHPP